MNLIRILPSFLCGLALVLQLAGCRNEELRNEDASHTKNPTAQTSGGQSTEKTRPPTPGPGEGGGGDPDAQAFIFLSQKLARFYRENPINMDLPFTPDQFVDVINKLDTSLKDPTVPDLVEFTSADLIDVNGTSKVALFDKKTGSIKINRRYWGESKDEDKFILINMEVAGLLGTELRYERSLALVKDRAAVILSMPISEMGEETPISWWIANQDPNLFARITINDVIIDGGIIGTGSSSNRRVLQFLEEPLMDQEWQSLAQKAFAKELPAYFLLRDQDGKRASLTAFRQTSLGIVTYTLLFFAKSKPVGLCDHQSKETTALERTKTCLFDTRFYQITDTQSYSGFNKNEKLFIEKSWQNAFTELTKNLISHFSYETETLATALQTSLVQDFRGVFTPQFDNLILFISARANGLQPSLTKGDTPFWEKALSVDPHSLRFFKAAEQMARDQVGFYPGQQPNCEYTLNGTSFSSTDEAPRIVPLKELHQMIREDRCLLRNGDGFYGKFYRALAQYGYEYNSISKEWRKKSPRKVSDLLIGSQFKATNEIETKIVTENLSLDQSYKLIKDAISTGDLKTRLLHYDILFRWNALGLHSEHTVRLFQIALNDISHLDATQNPAADAQDLDWMIDTVYPLEEFAEKSFTRAIKNELLTTELSKEYVLAIIHAPWLNKSLGQSLLLAEYKLASRTGDFSAFELALTTIMDRPFFDEHMAGQVLSQLRHETSIDASVRKSVLEKLIRTNLLTTPDDLKEIDLLGKLLSAGVQLEQKRDNQTLTLEERVALLRKMCAEAEDSSVLSPLIQQFLVSNRLSETLQNQLLQDYISLITRTPDPSEALRTLAMISFEVPMTKGQREKLYVFILQHFKDKEGTRARAFFIFEMQYTNKWSSDVRESFQKLLELIALSSTEQIGESGSMSAPEVQGHMTTEARRLVDMIADCRRPYPLKLCISITDPLRILSLIVLNSTLSAETRAAASIELRQRHY